ncbi:MAG: hypothetical protein IH939_18240 [Acidobacteria bacterium]|nr:hypothetical protein [Acidobacteriota bacterium]
MSQAENPHPDLVHARNAVQKCCGLERKEAAAACGELTNKDVTALLKCGDDKKKMLSVLRLGRDTATRDTVARDTVALEEPEESAEPRHRKTARRSESTDK